MVLILGVILVPRIKILVTWSSVVDAAERGMRWRTRLKKKIKYRKLKGFGNDLIRPIKEAYY